MNVCICVNVLNYAMGGVSIHILDLCKEYALHKEVENIIVCCDGGEHISTLLKINKVKFYQCSFLNCGMSIQGIFKSYKLLRNVILNEKIDIIHIHSQRLLPAAHLIKMRFSIPYLWTNHIDAIPNPRIFKVMCRVMKFPIISVSEELREIMIKQYKCNANKIITINNGTDLNSLYELSTKEKEILEEEWGINREKTPYVICLLSRIFYVKGWC